MINQINFSRGLVTNTDGVARPHETALEVKNARTQKQGWLTKRKGRKRLSDATNLVDVYTHTSVILTVDNRRALRWARLSRSGMLTFQNLGVVGQGGYKFHKNDDSVFISSEDEAVVVDVPKAPNTPTLREFYMDETPVPGVTYLSSSAVQLTKDINLKFQAIYVKEEQEELPGVQGYGVELPELAPRVVVAPESEPYGIAVRTGVDPDTEAHSIHEFITNIVVNPNPVDHGQGTNITFEVERQTPLRIDVFRNYGGTVEPELIKTLHDSLVETAAAGTPTPDFPYSTGEQTIVWDGRNELAEQVASGQYTLRFRFLSGIETLEQSTNDFLTIIGYGVSISDFYDDPSPDIDRTRIRITLPAPTDSANYVDVYASERENNENYYWIARMPFVAGEQLEYLFPFEEDSSTSELIFSGEEVYFQYIAVNKFRSYVAEKDANVVYLSYYDPSQNEQLLQNFSDQIELELGTGVITGLNFIRDNLLVVYATNQIQMIATDPLASQHQVIDQISPEDDKGNPIGCVAPDSIVDMGGTHIFLAGNDHIYHYNSRTARSMSDLVHVMFQTMNETVDSYGLPELSKAIGFAFDDDYYISIPSLLVSETDENNTTLVFETFYRRWWQDDFGIQSLAKGDGERLFGVLSGSLYELYTGSVDEGSGEAEKIRLIYESNPMSTGRAQKRYESVHVYPLDPAEIDIVAITEFGRHETEIDVEHIEDVWSCRAGVYNLRGQLHSFRIETESDAVIHRIATNEVIQNN
ncbi:hypothetical protein F4X90_20280 [Candidatus Poribacteria bacterium]|nr:hypothetical protein [Candidatus Poribacteria bacterium]